MELENNNPLAGEALSVAVHNLVDALVVLRANFEAKGQANAFIGTIMTLGIVLPEFKELFSAAVPEIPARKPKHTGTTTLRQMGTNKEVATVGGDCVTCNKTESVVALGATVSQLVKLLTSSKDKLQPGDIDITPGPVTEDQIGTRITSDMVHGPVNVPTDEHWAGLLTTLPTVDEALTFYFTLTGQAYPATEPRDHISILKAIHAYDDKL